MLCKLMSYLISIIILVVSFFYFILSLPPLLGLQRQIGYSIELSNLEPCKDLPLMLNQYQPFPLTLPVQAIQLMLIHGKTLVSICVNASVYASVSPYLTDFHHPFYDMWKGQRRQNHRHHHHAFFLKTESELCMQ